MAPTSNDDIITAILEHEGGFVDRPEDRGGPTNRGITLATLSSWRQTPVTPADVRSLTEAEVRAIYLAVYIQKPGFDQIPDLSLRAIVVDSGVLSGPKMAARWLQGTVGVARDGVIGRQTLNAIAARDARAVYLALCANRLRFIGAVITTAPSQAVFAAGWLNRVAEFVESAPLDLASQGPPG